MKRRHRRRRGDAHQINMPGIITAQSQAEGKRMVGEGPKRASWVEKNWPCYVRNPTGQKKSSQLQLWAQTFDRVSGGARLLLATLCGLAEEGNRFTINASIPGLARMSRSSVNATRTRLDALLDAGIVAVRPWKAPGRRVSTVLGYEFWLLIDEEHEAASRKAGFRGTRKSVQFQPAKGSAG